MEEDHTFASLDVCPCHQLRAHESRTEEHILWMGTTSFERPAHMNTQAVTRQPSSSRLPSSSKLRDLPVHRDHETCLSSKIGSER